MKEITEKLKNKVLEDFKPLAAEMIANGATKDNVVDFFQAQMRIKASNYHNKYRLTHVSREIKELIDKKLLGSKTEAVFYLMLKEKKIPFKSQYKIGPYRADYLIGESLVVEIDGPMHEKPRDARRDNYLKQMGYETFRVPTWILYSCPEAVIDEIINHVDR